jgi:hypothetical protein
MKENGEAFERESALREICFRLRGIAFLLENFRNDVGSPEDVDDCWYGVGSLLNEQISQLRKLLRVEID